MKKILITLIMLATLIVLFVGCGDEGTITIKNGDIEEKNDIPQFENKLISISFTNDFKVIFSTKYEIFTNEIYQEGLIIIHQIIREDINKTIFDIDYAYNPILYMSTIHQKDLFCADNYYLGKTCLTNQAFCEVFRTAEAMIPAYENGKLTSKNVHKAGLRMKGRKTGIKRRKKL